MSYDILNTPQTSITKQKKIFQNYAVFTLSEPEYKLLTQLSHPLTQLSHFVLINIIIIKILIFSPHTWIRCSSKEYAIWRNCSTKLCVIGGTVLTNSVLFGGSVPPNSFPLNLKQTLSCVTIICE